jgi:hypothetical protein
MQNVDLGLKQVEAAVPISAEHTETLISTFVDTDDWRTSLRRFGVYGPPSGDVEKNSAAVEQQMRASPKLSFAKTSSDSFKQPEVLPRIQDYEPRGEGLPGNGHPQTIDRARSDGIRGGGREAKRQERGCGVRVRW